MSSRAKLRSFTLIELLVVIGIIAILAGILTGAIAGVWTSAREAKAAHTIEMMQTAIDQFRTDYTFYPPDGTGTTAGLNDRGNVIMLEFLNGNGYLPGDYDPTAGGTDGSRHPYEYLESALESSLLDVKAADRAVWNDGAGERKEFWEGGEEAELLDPWDRPYQYVRYRDEDGQVLPESRWDETRRQVLFNGQPVPDPRDRNGQIVAQNKDKYDLWSVGENADDSNDDITNWD